MGPMANLISLVRTLMAILVIVLLCLQPGSGVYLLCFGLTAAVIAMDALDGYVARKLGETSKAGAVIDILGDRVVEQIYWVTFLALGWLPLWIPLVVIVRGVLTDGIRSIALEQGYTAFGQQSMQQSAVGRLLVSSNFSRTAYAVAKAFAFAFLILAHTPDVFTPTVANGIWAVGMGAAYVSVVFCVLRGLPVLVEGARFLWPAQATEKSG